MRVCANVCECVHVRVCAFIVCTTYSVVLCVWHLQHHPFFFLSPTTQARSPPGMSSRDSRPHSLLVACECIRTGLLVSTHGYARVRLRIVSCACPGMLWAGLCTHEYGPDHESCVYVGNSSITNSLHNSPSPETQCAVCVRTRPPTRCDRDMG